MLSEKSKLWEDIYRMHFCNVFKPHKKHHKMFMATYVVNVYKNMYKNDKYTQVRIMAAQEGRWFLYYLISSITNESVA